MAAQGSEAAPAGGQASEGAREQRDSRAPRTPEEARGAVGAADRLVIPDDVRAELADDLRDDVRRLRAYLGPSFDGWGIV